MAKSFINRVTIEGRLFSHDLKMKKVENKNSANFGKNFITGTINIAVDEDGINVIPVHFTYVSPTTKSGSPNQTYQNLESFIEDEFTWTKVGKEDAVCLRVNTSVDVNDFYSTRNEEMVSAKRLEGGFITVLNDPRELSAVENRNVFTTDMLITKAVLVEANEERNLPESLRVSGCVFRTYGDVTVLPAEFKITNPQGIAHLEGLDISNQNPIFTKVWGHINFLNTVEEIKEESAWGEAAVRTVPHTVRDWLITGMNPDNYDYGEDSDQLSFAEVQKAMENRNIHLAEVKQNALEYQRNRDKQQANAFTSPVTAAPTGMNYNF